MADSVTYEEFRKQERKKAANHTTSPTDTESTILEDLQSTVSEVQDNLRSLNHKSIKEGARTIEDKHCGIPEIDNPANGAIRTADPRLRNQAL